MKELANPLTANPDHGVCELEYDIGAPPAIEAEPDTLTVWLTEMSVIPSARTADKVSGNNIAATKIDPRISRLLIARGLGDSRTARLVIAFHFRTTDIKSLQKSGRLPGKHRKRSVSQLVCALSQPFLGRDKILRDKAMACLLQTETDRRPSFFQRGGKALGILRRNDWISCACTNQDWFSLQVPSGRRVRQRDHRAKENSAAECLGSQQQDGRGNVGAVGITDRDYFAGIELIAVGGRTDEIRQFICALDDVRFIKDALGKAAKEARAAVLGDFAARTQESSIRIQFTTQRNQIGFITAGAVE